MTVNTLIGQGIALRIPVKGSSMFPVLHTGDTVIVVYPDNLKKGDIILFNKEGGHDQEENLICHRIIRILKKEGFTYYVTRGDALLHSDRPVRADQVMGKVIGIERKKVSLLRRFFLLLNLFWGPCPLNALLLSVVRYTDYKAKWIYGKDL